MFEIKEKIKEICADFYWTHFESLEMKQKIFRGVMALIIVAFILSVIF